MKPMPKLLLSAAAAVLLSLASLPASAQQSSESPQKAEIEKIVHDYLIQHPEVIKEAIEALQAKEEAGKADSQAKTVAAHKGELLSDPATPVAGNPVGDVTIVEFFDYHCPYCKAVAGPLEQLLKDDKGVRLVLKEFPILGDDSVLASRAALASVAQGKYWAFHQALMEHRGSFDAETVRALAAGVGIDTKKLQADMADAKTSPLIEANHKLAEVLDVGATPTWVIGGKIVEGAVPLEQLKELIKQARGS